jgi:uncharacterized membrane protein YfcA
MQFFIEHINPFYVLCGILVGGLVGFTGVGGGSMMTPILILVFGVSPATAVGTDLVYAAITNASGSLVHGFNRTIDWKVVGRLARGSVPMTALSIGLLYLLGVNSRASHDIVTKVLGLALLLTAILLFARKPMLKWYVAKIGEPNPALAGRLTTAVGALLGILVTLSSVGAGAIGVTALVMLYPKMPAQRIVGSDIAHAVPLTLLAGLGHSLLGTLDTQILLSLLCGSLPAIVVASVASARMSDTIVRVTLGIVLLVVVLRFWFL